MKAIEIVIAAIIELLSVWVEIKLSTLTISNELQKVIILSLNTKMDDNKIITKNNRMAIQL
jgi:hypothetical protein